MRQMMKINGTMMGNEHDGVEDEEKGVGERKRHMVDEEGIKEKGVHGRGNMKRMG